MIKALLAVVCLRVFVAEAQTTVTIAAAADNTMYASAVNNSNARGENMFSGTNGGGSPRRALIRFDIAASIPAGAVITAASLTLNCNSGRTAADNISLHKVNAAWGEGLSDAGSGAFGGDGGGVPATANDATWTNRFFPGTAWIVPGGTYTATASASVSVSAVGFYTWSTAAMVADVQHWLNDTVNNFGWILICNEAVPATARKFGTKENAVTANRPALQVTYTISLPVILTFFNVKSIRENVQLTWQTANETDHAYFDVQHSTDGSRFETVAQINGRGSASSGTDYSYTHHNPAPGLHFYRLVQNDIGGSQTFSKTEKIRIGEKRPVITVFPNPAHDVISFPESALLNQRQYRMVDMSGKIVAEGSFIKRQIRIAHLPAGIYSIQVYDQGKPESQALFYKQ